MVNCDDLFNSSDQKSTFVTVQAYLNGQISEKRKAEANISNHSFNFKEEKVKELEV